MKKVLLLSLLLFICNLFTAVAFAQDEVNRNGNNQGNLKAGGYTAQQGDWIYFNDQHDIYSLFKVKKDGSSLTPLNEGQRRLARRFWKDIDYPQSINVAGNWIYYIGAYADDNNVFHRDITRRCVDGTQKSVLFPDIFAHNLHVSDNCIYFLNYSDNRSIYTANTDGTGLRKLSDHPSNINVFDFQIDNGDVYYISSNYELFKAALDGSDIKVFQGKYSELELVGEDIYFVSIPGMQLMKMNKEGTNASAVMDDKVSKFNITDNYIYYLSGEDNQSLWQVNRDGSGKKCLDEGPASNINTIGDWVTYTKENNLRYFLKPGSMEPIEMKFLDLALSADINGDQFFHESYGSRGNSIANHSSKRPIAVKQGEWIYFIKPVPPDSIQYTYAGSIFKIREDGTDETLVCSDIASNINVKDDWIYYIKVFQGKDSIYKIKTDGTERSQVATDARGAQDYLHIVEDYIYYNENFMDQGIVRMNLDGSDKQVLSEKEDTIQNFTVGDEWIYYEKSEPIEPDTYVPFYYKMKIDGSSKTRIGRATDGHITAFGDWVYFDNFKVRNEGTEKSLSRMQVLNIDGEWMYYRWTSNSMYEPYKERLCRVRLDGTGNTILNESLYIHKVNFAGDWIYFIANQDEKDETLYRMKNDGSDLEIVAALY